MAGGTLLVVVSESLWLTRCCRLEGRNATGRRNREREEGGFHCLFSEVAHIVSSWSVGTTGHMALLNWKWPGRIEEYKEHLIL